MQKPLLYNHGLLQLDGMPTDASYDDSIKNDWSIWWDILNNLDWPDTFGEAGYV
jgi:hypothetical protein